MLIAMDRQTVRTTSKDGYLHVATSHISKANVCPYRGREIPNGKDLGLDPDHVYMLLRHPDELAKAASTFNSLPVLIRHIPVTSAAVPKEFIVGATGTDAVWKAPYLDNSLTVWCDDGIAGVESEQQREISSAYHFIAEMTPGEFGGLHYDGIMRNIVGNHVTLVPEGRAGSDVIVMDSKLETSIMATALKSRKALMIAGAVMAYARPLLAQDAKLDLGPVLNGVTAKNFGAKKARLAPAIVAAMKPHLAMDADVGDVVELLDALKDATDGEIDDDMIEQAAGDPGPAEDPPTDLDDDDTVTQDADGDKIAQLMAFLKDKLSDDDFAAATELVSASADDPGGDPADTTPVGDGGGKPMKVGMDAKMVKATVAAAEQRVVARMRNAAQAREDVMPHVGKVSIALDSADDIYKFCLQQKGVKLDGVHPSAYRTLVGMIGKADSDKTPVRLAQDARIDGEASFAEMFPTAGNPRRI